MPGIRIVKSAALVTFFKACSEMGPRCIEPGMLSGREDRAVRLKDGIVDTFIADKGMAREISCYARSAQFEHELRLRLDERQEMGAILSISVDVMQRPVYNLDGSISAREVVINHTELPLFLDKEEGPSTYLRDMSIQDLFVQIALMYDAFYSSLDIFNKSVYAPTN